MIILLRLVQHIEEEEEEEEDEKEEEGREIWGSLGGDCDA
jgi:hypothetical protein